MYFSFPFFQTRLTACVLENGSASGVLVEEGGFLDVDASEIVGCGGGAVRVSGDGSMFVGAGSYLWVSRGDVVRVERGAEANVTTSVVGGSSHGAGMVANDPGTRLALEACDVFCTATDGVRGARGASLSLLRCYIFGAGSSREGEEKDERTGPGREKLEPEPKEEAEEVVVTKSEVNNNNENDENENEKKKKKKKTKTKTRPLSPSYSPSRSLSVSRSPSLP